MCDPVLFSNKGCLSEVIQLVLFQKVNIQSEIPKRMNEKDYETQLYIFRKTIKRNEILFSQICDQFLI